MMAAVKDQQNKPEHFIIIKEQICSNKLSKYNLKNNHSEKVDRETFCTDMVKH